MAEPSLKGRLIDFDNADLAIVGLCLLAGIALFVLKDSASQVLTTAVAAIAGLAQAKGRETKDSGTGT